MLREIHCFLSSWLHAGFSFVHKDQFARDSTELAKYGSSFLATGAAHSPPSWTRTASANELRDWERAHFPFGGRAQLYPSLPNEFFTINFENFQPNMNTQWLPGFPFNAAASKFYPPLAPVLIPPFPSSALTLPNLTSLPFNCNLSSSSTGSSSSTASSPFSLPLQTPKQESEPKVQKTEKSITNENLFPPNKSLNALSAKSQLFLIERLFPQLAAAAAAINAVPRPEPQKPEPIQSPQSSPTTIQKSAATPPINQVTLWFIYQFNTKFSCFHYCLLCRNVLRQVWSM